MVYQPAEDSYLLLAEVEKYLRSLKSKKIRVLDMGSGTGIQAITCIKAGVKRKNVLALDIDKEAVKTLKSQKLKAIQSDLFSKIPKSKKFDLIIFNPPYLPEDKEGYDKGKDTTGGKRGYETILKFLKQAKDYLSKNAAILILISSFSKPKIIEWYAKNLNYKIEKLAEKKLFFEKIEVWKLST